MTKTNLERSHSKFSNFKLTLLSLFELFGVTLTFLSLALKYTVSTPLFYLMLVVGLIVLALGLLGFNAFKR